MRDRLIQRVFIALIFATPALIVLATSVSKRSMLELAAVEVVVALGLFFASWAKAHSRRPKVVVPIRIAVVHPQRKHPVRTVA